MEDLSISFAQKLGMFLDWLSNPVSQMLFFPLLACLLICLTPPGRRGLIKLWAVLGAALSLIAALLMTVRLPDSLLNLELAMAVGRRERGELGPVCPVQRVQPSGRAAVRPEVQLAEDSARRVPDVRR